MYNYLIEIMIDKYFDRIKTVLNYNIDSKHIFLLR